MCFFPLRLDILFVVIYHKVFEGACAHALCCLIARWFPLRFPMLLLQDSPFKSHDVFGSTCSWMYNRIREKLEFYSLLIRGWNKMLVICIEILKFESGRIPFVRAWYNQDFTRLPGPTKCVFQVGRVSPHLKKGPHQEPIWMFTQHQKCMLYILYQ